MSTTSRVKEHASIVTASVTTNANMYTYSVGMGLHIFCKRVPCWFLFLFGSGVHLLQLHGSFLFTDNKAIHITVTTISVRKISLCSVNIHDTENVTN